MVKEMTKAQMKAQLSAQGIAFKSKATSGKLAELICANPVVTTSGLKIEKERPTRNGVTRPSAGGKCRAIWDGLDEFVKETGLQPTSATVRALAADEGWNPNNASIEFYQWRLYNK